MLLELVFIVLLLSLAYFLLQAKTVIELKLNSNFLFVALLFKCLMAGTFWYTYTHVHESRETADQYKYFDDALYLKESLQGNPGDQFCLIFNLPLKSLNQTELLSKTQHWDRSVKEAYNDNPLVIKLHLILMIFTHGKFALHALFFGFISFIGCLGFLIFIKNFSNFNISFLASFLFFYPSFVFWTSGVLKEAIVIFLLGSFLYTMQRFL